mmetsp:Transcript_9489/g.25272  ORF Transcript_9489/g.25272 Transcript_9489/m.25272 type:complete len:265 (+) Transcript_9489:206-1000(+)
MLRAIEQRKWFKLHKGEPESDVEEEQMLETELKEGRPPLPRAVNTRRRALMYVLHRVHPKMVPYKTMVKVLHQGSPTLFPALNKARIVAQRMEIVEESLHIGLILDPAWMAKFSRPKPSPQRRKPPEFGLYLRELGLAKYAFVVDPTTSVEPSLQSAVDALIASGTLAEGRYEPEKPRPPPTEEELRLKQLRHKLIKSRKARFSRMKMPKYRHPKPPPKSKAQLRAEAAEKAAEAAAQAAAQAATEMPPTSLPSAERAAAAVGA